MPFTFSHPAIVLPFAKIPKKYFYVPAAIIGCMAPDFEYFLRLRPIDQIGHSFVGVFIFDLPLVFIVFCLWEFLVKNLLIAHMPKPFDGRYSAYAAKRHSLHSLTSITVFILSALFGIFCHIFWDAFTHKSSNFLVTVPWVRSLVYFRSHPVWVYDILQQLSSMVGGVIVALWAIMHQGETIKKGEEKTSKQKTRYWLSYAALSVALFIIFLPIRLHMPVPLGFASLAVLCISAGIVGLTVHTLIYRAFDKK